MEIDPDNPVVQLCAKGIEAEMAGDYEAALDFYMRAWGARKDDYDACIVSHYVARLQQSPQDILRWNEESLKHANAVGDRRVEAFYPSLYLNMGKSHEDLGNRDEARKYYQLAESALHALPQDSYADMVKQGVREGLKRIG